MTRYKLPLTNDVKMFTIRKLLFLFMVGSITANESDPVTVTVPNGPILGHELLSYKNNTYYGFQEIPYAFPPTDDFRFKDPIPMKAWVGTWDATKNTKVCYQTGSHHTQKTVQTEDCLYLNVYTPVKPGNNASLLPVLFWIHGGGFRWGDGTYQYYGPDYFVDYDIVVVTINYRLGPFGKCSGLKTKCRLKLDTFQYQYLVEILRRLLQAKAVVWTICRPSDIEQESRGCESDNIVMIGASASFFSRSTIAEGTALCSEAHQDYAKYFAHQLGSALNQNFTTKILRRTVHY
ncbi:hypothetical protein NQ317_000247 [Molorchus minor]|uniref:Carboxylesterase type B domain-containing protein n=1 Tax=Molorchus minor TaxID=1323400 RepID=A0ABQ9JSV5_9CUCU|nr:hypothetical protein NQ317_000247 [Molorchus minor]